MFISKFSVDNWETTQNKNLVIPAQNWTGIETVIKELDGQHKTLVTLETDGETHMAIGGGTSQYLVYLTFDNETFHYLVDPSKSDIAQSLVVGGQEGIYPAKLCVGISAVLKAAKTFAEFGTMEKSVSWEKDRVVEPV
jgi:hypothetical protein